MAAPDKGEQIRAGRTTRPARSSSPSRRLRKSIRKPDARPEPISPEVILPPEPQVLAKPPPMRLSKALSENKAKGTLTLAKEVAMLDELIASLANDIDIESGKQRRDEMRLGYLTADLHRTIEAKRKLAESSIDNQVSLRGMMSSDEAARQARRLQEKVMAVASEFLDDASLRLFAVRLGEECRSEIGSQTV